MSNTPLILVVGMHRSGTSLLGSILQAIGVATPGELIPGDVNNPEGYFERRDITDLQEQLLIRLGRWWPSAEGVLELPSEWLCQACTRQALDQLRAILAAESQRQTSAWAIKDPRSSLLLPLWRRICGDLRIPLRLLLAVRDPAEVAASLCHRDAEAAGMTAMRAEQLWWRHHQAVLEHSVDLPLEIIDYGRWFDSVQSAREQLLRLIAFCDLRASSSRDEGGSDPRLSAALQQIRPEHRRSRGIVLAGQTPAQIYYRKLRHSPVASSTDLMPLRSVSHLSARQRLSSRWWRIWHRLHLKAESWAQIKAWFDPQFYRNRHLDPRQDHDPLLSYLTRGWREGHQPHPLFDPAFYLAQCHLRGLVPGSERSLLEHFLGVGIRLQIPCTPLLDSTWFHQHGRRFLASGPPALSDLHPWGGAALALADHDLSVAACLLADWQHKGLQAADLGTIHAADRPWLRWDGDQNVLSLQPMPIGRLESLTLPSSHWRLHGWRASFVDPAQPDSPGRVGIDAALLIPLLPGEWPNPGDIQRILGAKMLLLDPDPDRCRTWLRLGCSVARIFPPTPAQLNAWLPADPWLERAAVLLDLPRPETLTGIHRVCLGCSGGDQPSNPKPGTIHLPSFQRLILDDDDARRALAAWLWHCRRCGLELEVTHGAHRPVRVWSWLARDPGEGAPVIRG